jgi:predicted ATP-dependent Lon-type protease
MRERYVKHEEFQDFKQRIDTELKKIDKINGELVVSKNDHKARIEALENRIIKDYSNDIDGLNESLA